MNIKKTRFTIQAIGTGPVVRSARYTIFKDRALKPHPMRWETFTPVLPGRVKRVIPVQNGASFKFEHAGLEVIFLTGDLVRLSWEPGIPPLPYALARTEWPGAEIQISERDGVTRLESSSLAIEVSHDGSVFFFDENGLQLRAELPPKHQIAELGLPRSAQPHLRWTHPAILTDEERVYGLGERAAALNRRGHAYRMWNTDPGGSYGPGVDPLYMCIPVYMGLHEQGSYLIFYENPYPATFTFENPVQPAIDAPRHPHAPAAFSAAEACFEGGMLRYYFMPGPPERALARYTELTGRPLFPPRWVFGYHQSRWGYRSESDIREVAAGFKEHQMPVSAIHLDIDYMDGYRIFSAADERFPRLGELTADLSADGIRIVTIIDPGVKVDRAFHVYTEGLERGVFCTLPDGKLITGMVWPGWCAFPDFTDPKARQWWGEQYPFLLDRGVAGVWHDMNEPSTFSTWGEITLPPEAQHNLEGRGGDHREAHNLYGFLMNRAGYEALRELRPDRRPWIISRSGWAGQQRYAWNWTGDIESSWKALAQTIPTVLGLGLSGLPFTGPDIGGFSGNPTPEMYVRWLQMAAFLPFYRTHSAIGTERREPWVYGEPYNTIVREFLHLRYRLMAYLYTSAWETSQTGSPMIRPLFWDNPADRKLWDIEDSFLLGRSLLVAPVIVKGARDRLVHLPAGYWHSFWEERVYAGDQDVFLEAPLGRIPVLVRTGSILPMELDGELELHLFGTQPGTSQLYLDAGDGYGPFRLEEFILQAKGNDLSITRQIHGEYPFPYSNLSLILHGIESKRAWVDGKIAPVIDRRLETGNFSRIVIEV